MTQVESFASLAHILDSRILTGLSRLGFDKPTLVQATAIPLALEGRDIACRAKTGSGKTLAYGIPIVQNLLKVKSSLDLTDPLLHNTRALILVPTRELSTQVASHLSELCSGLGEKDRFSICNISSTDRYKGKGKAVARAEKVHEMQLLERPDIVIATPSRALQYLRNGSLSIKHLESLVIDEADLILSYGTSSEDIRSILSGTWDVPTVYQSYLMSATMTDDVDMLKGIVLRRPAVLKLEDDPNEINNLSQYYATCSEEEKFLLLYVLLKLKLIKGKALIFVNETDRSYKVKLFLEKFGIRAGVLNSELPFNSRYHAVQDFNRGAFDYLIATDKSENVQDIIKEEEEQERKEKNESRFISTSTESKDGKEGDDDNKTGKKRKRSDENGIIRDEYGVSRGIDFVDVACVINFDLPSSTKSYAHRIGRTARAGRSGMALSFVIPRERWGKVDGQITKVSKRTNPHAMPLFDSKYDEKVWSRITKNQENRGAEITQYKFDMNQVNGFRYRMEDALKAITSASIREARVKEIKNEIINSEKLKSHFEENPTDLDFLRHDKPVHPARVQSHLKHVPSYLMPRIASSGGGSSSNNVGNVGFRKKGKRAMRGRSKTKKDPLRTFKKK